MRLRARLKGEKVWVRLVLEHWQQSSKGDLRFRGNANVKSSEADQKVVVG